MTARTATLAIAGLLLAGGATFILGQRDQRLVTCRNAMAQIAGAKGSHGLEHRLAPGNRVSSQAISPLLARGWEGLRCPSGGQYDSGRFTGDKETGAVRHAPSCSVHGSLADLQATVRRPWVFPGELSAVPLACLTLAAGIGFLYARDGRRETSDRQAGAARPG